MEKTINVCDFTKTAETEELTLKVLLFLATLKFSGMPLPDYIVLTRTQYAEFEEKCGGKEGFTGFNEDCSNVPSIGKVQIIVKPCHEDCKGCEVTKVELPEGAKIIEMD